ncbi:TPA: hypothetical protein ACXIJW_002338 [Serratia marcescens]|jgi:preprotein translocase subunit SecB
MQLRLASNRVKELHIIPSAEKDKDSNKIKFGYESVQVVDKKNDFLLTFDFQLISDRGFELSLKHEFTFETDRELDDIFWSGSFHKINAPAIAYPYLRAFVSTILLNAGLEAVTLPSVNFVELSKSMKEELKSK